MPIINLRGIKENVMRVESRLSKKTIDSYRFKRVRNSSRVFCWVRKQPSMHEVVVIEPGFCTPRIVMHKWLNTGTGKGVVKKRRGERGEGVRMAWNVGGAGAHERDGGGKKWRRDGTYVASMTTATPRGLIASCTQRAICFVRRSWT